MKMIDMDIYFKDRGFAVDRQYECVNNESLYRFTISKDGKTLVRTFRYPASDNNAYKSKLQTEFLKETIKAFDELYSKAEPNFQFTLPKGFPWVSEIMSLSEQRLKPRIKNVIFNDPATIVFWTDGTKTVVKCQDGDIFDPEKGLALAISKKALGNKGNYCNELKKWLPKNKNKSDVAELEFTLECDGAEILKSIANNGITKAKSITFEIKDTSLED